MYDKKQSYDILTNAAIYVDADGSYDINFVPAYDDLESGEDFIHMTNEETGEDCSLSLDDIDLNNPECLVYRLVLSNPVVKPVDNNKLEAVIADAVDTCLNDRGYLESFIQNYFNSKTADEIEKLYNDAFDF